MTKEMRTATRGGTRYQSLIFGALARKGLRAQGASALTREDRASLAEKAKKAKAEKVHCSCKVVQHVQIPHPKYGDKVAHWADTVVPDFNCIHRQQEGPLQAPSVAVETPAEPEGTPGSNEPAEPVAAKCTAFTKNGDGPRCSRDAVPGLDGFCRQHGE